MSGEPRAKRLGLFTAHGSPLRMERLHKIIARAGLASRREAERWILDGRVTVNGQVVRKLGSHADPAKDKIKVDGKLIPAPPQEYFLFHKPAGMITSMRDPEGRPHLGEWLGSRGRKGLFPAGRLDFASAGLLLVTNDGELAYRLTHPRYEISKIYRVKINGHPSESDLDRLREGIELEEGRAAPAKVRLLKAAKKSAWLEVEIHEGRYREVRRMFELLGYTAQKLVRVRLGPIRLGLLPAGGIRALSPREVAALKKAVGMEAGAKISPGAFQGRGS